MKKIFFICLLIWVMLINMGKVWPISRGEKYYRNLQKWYLLVSKGDWEKAKVIESKLKRVCSELLMHVFDAPVSIKNNPFTRLIFA